MMHDLERSVSIASISITVTGTVSTVATVSSCGEVLDV